MKIYDTNYGPDTFGRIRMGLIKEMFLTFEGYSKPEVGDQLRVSCLFKGVVRDVYTVAISRVSDCIEEPETVLISIALMSYDADLSSKTMNSSDFFSNGNSSVIH